MAYSNLTLLQGQQIDQKRSITIDGQDAVLYAKADMDSLLPSNFGRQTCLYVAIDHSSLTIEAFDKPITVSTTFSTQDATKKDGPFEFSQKLVVRSITRLPQAISRGSDRSTLYAYRLDCGYPNFTTSQLASRRTKFYQGTPKEVILAALADAGLESNNIDATQLSSQAFIENIGWYAQLGETTEEFVRQILAENGGILFLNNDNVVTLLDTPNALIDASQYEIGATIQNITPNMTQSGQFTQVQLYNFRSTRSRVPVQKFELKSHPLTKTDLRSGVGKYDANTAAYNSTHQIFSVHASLPGDALNTLASNLLEADTYTDNLYTATTAVPFTIGEVISVKVYGADENNKPQTHKLMVVASTGQHSFETAITEANANAHTSWTGVENGYINYELTLIDATKLPRMPMPTMMKPDLTFRAIIVDKNGATDSKVAPDETQVYAGLLFGNQREANKFTSDNIIPLADHIEPISLTNSVPAPGTIVRMVYSPSTKSFYLDGRIVTGDYTMNTTIKNDSNAKQASDAWITFSPNEINITVGPNNKTTAAYSAAGYSFSHDTMKVLLDKGFSVEQANKVLFKQPQSCSVEGAGKFSVISTTPAVINSLKA